MNVSLPQQLRQLRQHLYHRIWTCMVNIILINVSYANEIRFEVVEVVETIVRGCKSWSYRSSFWKQLVHIIPSLSYHHYVIYSHIYVYVALLLVVDNTRIICVTTTSEGRLCAVCRRQGVITCSLLITHATLIVDTHI